MNSYEEKQQAKRDRLNNRAERQRAEGNAAINRASDMASVIPMGQPILIGHHSERRDRNFRGKIDNTFRNGFAKLDQAKETAARAAAVGTGGVSSDDPDAGDKLAAKLADRIARQARMKAANAAIRKHKKDGEAAQIAALVALGIDTTEAVSILKPDFCGRVGFPDYSLQNNNAEIRRLQKRIESLQAAAKAVDVEQEGAGYTYREDVEDNRIHFVFEGKPDDATRAILKGYAFKWSPSRGAWVRQLNGNGKFAAKIVRDKLDALAKTP